MSEEKSTPRNTSGGSRTGNVLKNIKFGTINQIASILLNLISRTVFVRVLGASYLGINGLFSDVLQMLCLADLGLNTAMVYSFYRPLAENDHAKVTSLVQFYKKVYNWIAFVVAAVGLLLVPFLQYIVNLDQGMPYLKLYYLFFLADTVISYLFVYKTSILNADQKNYYISFYTTIFTILKMICQVVLLITTHNYFTYLICQIVGSFAINYFASRKSQQLYPYITEKAAPLSHEEKKSIWENIKSVFIYKVSSVLMNGTDNTLISILVGTVWTGYYSNYNLITNGVGNFVNIIYSSSTASIGNLVVTSDKKKRVEVFRSLQAVSLIITTFTTICFTLLFSDLMHVWLGDSYVLDNVILTSIMINYYLSGVLHPIWSYREATGLYRQTKYIMLICAIENIGLSILMGIYMGMAGVLFASAISRLTTYFWYEPKILFKEYFGVSTKIFYLPLIRNVLLTLGAAAVIYFITSFIHVNSWGMLFVKAIIVALLSLITVILVYSRTDGYKLLYNRIMGRLKRR